MLLKTISKNKLEVVSIEEQKKHIIKN